MTPQSFGQRRVGVTFNPSGKTDVNVIKEMAAALIDTIDEISTDDRFGGHGETARCKALAMTAIEEGAMWAVKAITKP